MVRRAIVLACAALLGCNAILGNQDVVVEPAAVVPDAGPPDAPSEPAPCANAACMEDLLTGLVNPSDVTADATNIYVTESSASKGSVRSCPTASCSNASSMAIAIDEGDPEQIVLDDTNVYWVDEYAPGGVHACSRLRGCAPSTLLVASETRQITYHVVVSPDALYYADGLGDLYQADKSVRSAGTLIGSAGALVSALTFYGGDLVWAAFEQTKGASIIQACSAASCTETLRTVAVATFQGAAIAVDASGVYFIDGLSGTGSLYHCPDDRSCPSPDVLTTGIASPGRMLVDAKNVYFTAASGVFMCPKSGCAAPTPLAMVTGRARGLASDGKYIYFVSAPLDDSPTGALHRIPAPP